MSSPERAVELGHPPAVKAGGMRITQNKGHLRDRRNSNGMPEPTEEMRVSTSPPKHSTALISGAPNRGHADFPEQAVQAFHNKPVATHDLRSRQPVQGSRNIMIDQPRRITH